MVVGLRSGTVVRLRRLSPWLGTIMFALEAALFVASIAVTASADPPLISFNISFTRSPLMQMFEDGVHPKVIEATFMKKNVTNDTVPLHKYLDNEFYGEVLLGHPGQKFKMIFDTSWSNTWVPSSLCNERLYTFCENHQRYDSTKSSTKIVDGRSIKIPYGNSSLEGLLSIDLLHLGHINVTNMTFMEATVVPASIPGDMKADGVVGLAFKSLALLNVTPFMDKLVEQHKFKKVFSFYFNRDVSTGKGGTLFLGGSQKKHYIGDFTYVDLISADYWRFVVTSIRVKGSIMDFCEKGGCPVIVDTSSTSITGPSNTIEMINTQIRAKKFIGGLYMVDCNTMKKLPSVTFVFGGRDFVLKSRDYVRTMNIQGKQVCLSVFEANDFVAPFQNYWTLGVSFMARFYVEFDADNKRIGFADVRM